MSENTNQERVAMTFKLDPGVRRLLEILASGDDRSMTNYIETLIREQAARVGVSDKKNGKRGK